MSYDVTLLNSKGTCVQVEAFEDGGTYALGGSTIADFNITYNYDRHYYKRLDKESGLKWLNGKRGRDCVARLTTAIEVLGTKRSDDYWEDTPGNAGAALYRLLTWALEYPDAIFKVT